VTLSPDWNLLSASDSHLLSEPALAADTERCIRGWRPGKGYFIFLVSTGSRSSFDVQRFCDHANFGYRSKCQAVDVAPVSAHGAWQKKCTTQLAGFEILCLGFTAPSGLDRPMKTPFDSIESAQEYMVLLREAVADAKGNAETDILAEEGSKLPRRLDALRLVSYKLDKLEQHVKASCRLLNDLRTLRRLLLEERSEATVASHGVEAKV
jgi:hypothetical protein